MNLCVNEIRNELVNHILPFWMKLIDKKYGGFYGSVDQDLQVNESANKSCIINSRILWSFSSAFTSLKNPLYLSYADHAYQFLIEKFLDVNNGGLFLFVDHIGNSIDKRKHINNLCYAVYALSEYYKCTHNYEVKNLAISFFKIIESKRNEKGFYLEEFDDNWTKKSNEFLDRFDLHAEFTFNNYIHILESYTNLYSIWDSNYLLNQIHDLLNVFERKLFSYENCSFHEFFDLNMQSLINLQIFGHDIEASWLLSNALEVSGLDNDKIEKIVEIIAKNLINEAMIDNSVILESNNGIKNQIRMWWVQTESIIGLMNAYQLFGDEIFLENADKIWTFVKTYFIDTREGGEWFSTLDTNYLPKGGSFIVDEWKSPYHNTRMCLEILERLQKVVITNV